MRRTTLAAIGIGLWIVGCGGTEVAPVTPPPPVAPPPTAAPVAAAAAVEAKPAEPPPDLSKAILSYVAAFNGGKLDQASQAFGETAEWISAGSLVKPATGRTEIARGWQELREIFDIKVGVRRLIVSEGMWVAEGVLYGSHVGGFHGLAATKKPVGVEYVHVGWIEGGKIKKLLSLSNGTAFPGQIGYAKGEVVAIPATPGEPEIVNAKGDAGAIAAAETLAVSLLQGDVGSAPLAADAVLFDRAAGKSATGLDAIKKHVGAMGGLKGVKRDVKSFAAGPYVVSIGMTTGTMDKTEVTFHTVEVVKMKDGKALEVGLYRNPKEIADQMPEPAAAKKK